MSFDLWKDRQSSQKKTQQSKNVIKTTNNTYHFLDGTRQRMDDVSSVSGFQPAPLANLALATLAFADKQFCINRSSRLPHQIMQEVSYEF